MRSLAFVVFALAVPACSSTATSGSGSGSGASAACLDTADAVGKAAMRCGMDYQKNYDAFIQVAAKGNCSNIIAIRDEAALRATCIPSFATISCANLAAGNIDATCKAQLQHPAWFAPVFTQTSSIGEVMVGPSID